MKRQAKRASLHSISFHSDDFCVGGAVAFRRTTGDYVSGIMRGVVLAIGQQREDGSDRLVDGAVVAWEADRFDRTNYPACVGFCPFWNQRFTAVPDGM